MAVASAACRFAARVATTWSAKALASCRAPCAESEVAWRASRLLWPIGVAVTLASRSPEEILRCRAATTACATWGLVTSPAAVSVSRVGSLVPCRTGSVERAVLPESAGETSICASAL